MGTIDSLQMEDIHGILTLRRKMPISRAVKLARNRVEMWFPSTTPLFRLNETHVDDCLLLPQTKCDIGQTKTNKKSLKRKLGGTTYEIRIFSGRHRTIAVECLFVCVCVEKFVKRWSRFQFYSIYTRDQIHARHRLTVTVTTYYLARTRNFGRKLCILFYDLCLPLFVVAVDVCDAWPTMECFA